MCNHLIMVNDNNSKMPLMRSNINRAIMCSLHYNSATYSTIKDSRLQKKTMQEMCYY